MNAIDVVTGWFIVCVIVACLYAHARSEASKPRDDTFPKLPELICTCGDCWELSRDKETSVVCGCGNEYIVSATNVVFVLGGDI